MIENVFLVSWDIQKDQIDNFCFGTCQAINFGAITCTIQGLPMVFLPCCRADCPHLHSQIDEPTYIDDDGINYFLRRLNDLPTAEKRIRAHA